MTADTSVSTSVRMGRKEEKEVIHSGHFMVSDFEADAQDDEENVLLEIPGDELGNPVMQGTGVEADQKSVITYHAVGKAQGVAKKSKVECVAIDSSLTKLFNAMSIAYRHKISSPKWNRFKGLKLRWKDKIRLNNVIWRCWHMQFIRKKKMTVCQFALDVDMHNKPEAIVLEGKYWKRQLEAVTAEYKKWRIYYKNRILGQGMPDGDMSRYKVTEKSKSLDEKRLKSIFEFDGMDFTRAPGMPMSFDDGDLSEFMDFTDVLFSSLVNPPAPFAFPNPREIARGCGNSDFMQPGLIQLQPNLDDFMDIVEPLQEMLAGRGLPTVPEEDLMPEVGETPQLPAASPPTVTLPLHYDDNFLESSSPILTQSPSHKDIQQLHQTSVYGETQRSQHQSGVGKPQQQLVALPNQSPPDFSASLSRSPNIPCPQTQSIPVQQQHSSPLQLHHPHTPPQLQLHHSSTPPQQLQQPLTPPQQQPSSPLQRHQPGHRSFIRSHSQHDLTTQPQISGQESTSFIIPKSLPRRWSHSSNGINSNNGMAGSSSLAPHQVITSMPITTLPHILPAPTTLTPTTLAQMTSTPSVSLPGVSTSIITTPVIQAGSAPGGSALLAQLLTSGSYAVSCSSQPISTNQLAAISHTNQLSSINTVTVPSSNNVKVSLVIPGVITGNNSSGSSSSSSSSNSSLCNMNSTSNMTNIKPSVSPILMQPIRLSAVTPSNIKAQPFTQMSPWSPCSPQGIMKHSPPYPEPSSPLMMNIPSPPNKAFRPKSDTERVQYKEHRRVCHINAEQKRRSNLKNNFDILLQLIPSISQNPNAKISKAALLQKGADYIHQLKAERQQLTDQAEKLRQQIENLSVEISNAQALLPATGAPMTHARHSKLKEMFNNYIRERTLSNWKFYIFSLITEPLLDSFNTSVSTSSLDDLCRSSLAWLDQQCSLNILRPLVSNSMRKLSTTTNVLAEPEGLPEEVFRRVTKQEGGERYHSSR